LRNPVNEGILATMTAKKNNKPTHKNSPIVRREVRITGLPVPMATTSNGGDDVTFSVTVKWVTPPVERKK